MASSLRDDRRLSREHVQSLSSADRLAEFFATLRYPDDARLEMTPGALQLPQRLKDVTRRVERLTSVEGGALQVYLFELTSVTVAHTRALARAFRNRAGNFLLVLTDDYERIDFVLLEREVPGLTDDGPSRRGVTVRPRVLSVERRDPGRVALRVLRRFTFTEYDADGRRDPVADAYGQWEKLKSAYTVAEWSEPLFNNRALFSDYYLNERLPDHPAWEAEGRNRAFRAVRKTFAGARRRFAGEDAATIRRDLIRPLLETLGFRVHVPAAGAGDRRDEAVKRPRNRTPSPPRGEGRGETADFLLYTEGDEEPAAFVLAYPWNRYLDGKDGKRDDERPEENPGAQVVTLLEAGAADWGIVTNGKTWRLYSSRAHSRATNTYEVNLEETLASPDPGEPFRYFYLFFRAEAFAPEKRPVTGKTRELTFLDWLMDESQTYARELGERLKERVFEEIFPHFAEGFILALGTRAGMGGPETLLALPEEERQEQLDRVYQGTLTFLYRLLFLLYAESRDLLPVREVRGYYRISLRRLSEEVAEQAGPLEDLVPRRLEDAYPFNRHSDRPEGAERPERVEESRLYGRLLDLFKIIDSGSPARNVPTYNGGLFITEPGDDDTGREAQAARFLEQTALPDRYLALGLDRLARDVDPKRGDLGFIDYKSLGVRQLGSIYEGLLEFNIQIAAGEGLPNSGRSTSEVYLMSDKGERKATGSYYTPDYIVKYIVRHTVGPVLDEKLDALRPRLHEAEERFRKVVKRKVELEGVIPDEPMLLQNVAGEALHDLFDVKICDPAMGSGHFLVEAVDYVTDRLVRFLDGFSFLGVFFEGMRRSILEEMERQKVTVDPGQLTDVTLLQRHVLKRCIYGVDLNPMAVELAKLSLWLDCFTLGAPLSFLDHHLRCGNSLIGAMAQEVEEEIGSPTPDGQMTFLTGPFVGLLQAADVMQVLSRLADVTLEQVRESRSLFDDFEKQAKPFKQLLDIHVAQHFGVKRAEEFLTLYGAEAMEAQPEELDKPYREVVERTRELYEEKRFFHWDLEFPEVFIDLERAAWKEDGGFDAVVGNPPWLMAGYHETTTLDYFRDEYRSAKKKFDLYYLFLERSSVLVSAEGAAGMIVPNKFFHTRAAANLRTFLAKGRWIRQIVDFRDSQVFAGATNYSCILLLLSEPTDGLVYLRAQPGLEISEEFDLAWSALSSSTWNFEAPAIREVFGKMEQVSAPLDEFSSGFGSGVQSGADRLLVVDAEVAKELGIEDKMLRTFLKGRDVRRYRITASPQFLIFPYEVAQNEFVLLSEENLERHERAHSFLKQHKQDLSERVWFGRDAKELSGKWYGMMYLDSYETFDSPHILTPSLSDRSNFSLGTGDIFATGTAGVTSIIFDDDIPEAMLYFLAVLNSRLISLHVTSHSPVFSGDYYKFSGPYLKETPIRRIHFTTSEASRQRLVDDLVARYQRDEYGTLLTEIEALLPKNEDGEFLAFQPGATGAEEKSDVVHDLLAYLAEHMIAMHEEKQARVEVFWDDLEAACESPRTLEELREHGKWEQSLWKDPACRAYADRESRSTRHLDESLGWDEGCFEAFAGMLAGKTSVTRLMIDVYRKHHPAYKDLVERIDATDDLIDQIVYRLYGLTEEEIAVVEGREP